ncbi:MAG: hypothetical protein GAK28_00727 [Luteibacter sp.]|uniref:hypothetical protein n=1 Tax=Luteibacter sp. TaxID=1886636 RepID=UPI00137F25AC|nr:hypothetical protein [Luteibacter sp.]KAF1009094.1 MAG: hypothetical protein GAK28_00727 [Luteibacter sp.]
MRRRIEKPCLYTGDLFEIPQPPKPVPGTMDYRPLVSELASTMFEDAARLGLDRHAIAAEASRLTGKDVSKSMLDGYTAPARDAFNLPLWLAPVLETICQSTTLGNWHAHMRGGRLLVGADTLDAEIGRAIRERATADARLRELAAIRKRMG